MGEPANAVLMLLANPFNPDWRVQKEAIALQRAGFVVTILSRDPDGRLPADETVDGIRVIRVKAPGVGKWLGTKAVAGIAFWWRTLRVARRLRFAVAHCHDLPTLPAGVYLKLTRQCHLVYDAHEVYWMMVERSHTRTARRLLRLLEAALVRAADRVITVSELRRPYFRHRHPIQIVGNWYDPVTRDPEARRHLRDELGIGEGLVLACVGSLGPQRLQDLLVSYAEADRATTVLIAGRGSEDAKLEQAAGRIPNLHFLGWQSDPRPIYAAADALFYALAADDGYSQISSPNTMFLSIAWTIPMVTTPTGEAGSIISQTGAGELLEAPTVDGLRDAIARLRRRQTEITARLKELQADYSWAVASRSLVDLYRSGLG
jgi:glycosyltransferase involved in cell wall biosynthesis